MADNIDDVEAVAKQLETIHKKIEESQRKISRTQTAVQLAHAKGTIGGINNEDIVQSFNADYIPQFKAGVFDQVEAELLEAKINYYKAMRKFTQVKAEFEETRRDARNAVPDKHYWQFAPIHPENRDWTEKYMLTEKDIYTLETNPLSAPANIKYLLEEA